MGTSTQERYRINGIIDTSKSVMDNLTEMANSCGTWLTFDGTQGRWSVIINQPAESQYSFNDSNIIGTIEVSGSGFRDLYNSVKVTYPRSDIRDQLDFIKIDVASEDQNPNEIPNILDINYTLVTDPIQAEMLGFIELKQARLDRIIKFRTDWTNLGLLAGDVIDVTASNYGFDQELFRVISISETSGDGGGIVLDITAMAYDETLYDEDFYRYIRSTSTGIVTIGDIGTPIAPQITKIEQSARPRLVLEATIPIGIVERMEYWISSDNTNFSLVATKAPENGGVFATSQVVSLEVTDNIPIGDVYCKVRATNSTTTSEFSSVSSIVYEPLQTTDAISPDTKVVDGTGALLTSLAASYLLNNLDKLLALGDATEGSIFDKIFSIFSDETGYDILGTTKTNGGQLLASNSDRWRGSWKYMQLDEPADAEVGDVWFEVDIDSPE